METLERNEWADVAQLVEITSDAVIICELDGTILHVNNRLLGLMCEERADVIGGVRLSSSKISFIIQFLH